MKYIERTVQALAQTDITANDSGSDSSADRLGTHNRCTRQERAQLMLRRILDAAYKMLDRKGIENYTMREIAKEGSLSIGSVYSYFPSRVEAEIRCSISADEKLRSMTQHFEQFFNDSYVRILKHYGPPNYLAIAKVILFLIPDTSTG